MEKKIYYRLLIIALLLLNIGSLGYIYKSREEKKPLPQHHEGPRKIIIDVLGFNSPQIAKYDACIKIHRTDIHALQLKRVAIKNKLHALLRNSEIDFTKKDSLIDLLRENHAEVEKTHFQHFLAIKSLCQGPDQLQKFHQLTKELSIFFAPPPMKK
jgi:periplasmic protein CpxP/Spy